MGGDFHLYRNFRSLLSTTTLRREMTLRVFKKSILLTTILVFKNMPNSKSQKK